MAPPPREYGLKPSERLSKAALAYNEAKRKKDADQIRKTWQGLKKQMVRYSEWLVGEHAAAALDPSLSLEERVERTVKSYAEVEDDKDFTKLKALLEMQAVLFAAQPTGARRLSTPLVR